MQFIHTHKFIKSNESKRIWTGQTTVDGLGKLYFWAFVVTFICATFFFGYFLLLFKKKQFHPYVFVEKTNNPVDIDKVSKLLKKAGYEIEKNEKAIIFINIFSDEFLLFTDQNVYYTLRNSPKITDVSLTSGKLPIISAKDIKTSKTFAYLLTLNFSNEEIGSLTDGGQPRIIGLLKEFSKDLRENFNNK